MTAAALAASIALPVIPASPASAYATNGCRWGGNTINWNFYQSTNSTYETAIKNAAASWNVTQFSYSYVTSGFPPVRANATYYGTTGWDGLTQYTCSSSGFFNPTVGVLVNRTYTDGEPAHEIRSIAAHEFGHALGLAHTGDESTPCSSMHLMNHFTDARYERCGVYTPQPDDINGANAIY